MDERPSIGSRVLRAMTFSLLGLVLMAMAGALAVIMFPPTGLVRDQLAAAVKQRTGRDLVIAGPVSMRLVPSIAVSFKDVTLSSPPGMAGAPVLRTEELALELDLLPLLTREIVVDRLVLRGPVIDLRVDANGRRNWDFAEAGDLRDGSMMRYAQATPRGPDGRPLSKELQDFVRNSADGNTPRRKLAGINDLSLGAVRIANGTVRYADARGPAPIEINGIDAHLSLRDLAGPLVTAGHVVHAGERIAFDARLTSLRNLMDEQPVKLIVKLNGKPADLLYDGALTTGGPLAVDGRLELTTPSLDGLARFLQLPVSGLDPLGPTVFAGQVKLAGTSLAITGGNLSLAGTSATGSLSVDAPAGQRPQVKTQLKFAALDLDRLTSIEPVLAPAARRPDAPAAEKPPAAATAPSPPAASPAPRTGRFAPPDGALAPANSIEELLNRQEQPAATPAVKPGARPGTAVRGFTRREGEGWSSEPLHAAPLRLIDLDGRFELASLTSGRIKLGASQIAANLKSGVLKLDIARLDLFGGQIKGLVSLDAREPDLVLGANLTGDGVAALAFMQAVSNVDFLDGRTRIALAVSAKGGSERELIGTLAGKAELKLTDGALLGWDASQMIGGLGQGRLPKLDRSPGARTPFSEVSGTFQIANGVARNQDLKVESPAVRAGGSGVINLVDRNINMLVKPQATGVGGIEVPIRIAGPFDNPSVVPDVNAVLKTPQAQEAVKKLRDGDIEGAARDVLGGGPKADEKIGKAKELLKNFLNR